MPGRTQEYAFDKYILPALGNLPLDQVSTLHVKDFIPKLLRRGLARDSIGLIVRTLSAVLNHGFEDGLLVKNPADRMGRYYKHAPVRRGDVRPLNEAEVIAFLETAPREAPD